VNEASPLYTSTIVERCTQKLVDDWNAMRCEVWGWGWLAGWLCAVLCCAVRAFGKSSFEAHCALAGCVLCCARVWQKK
jgi:hypothetical protein